VVWDAPGDKISRRNIYPIRTSSGCLAREKESGPGSELLDNVESGLFFTDGHAALLGVSGTACWAASGSVRDSGAAVSAAMSLPRKILHRALTENSGVQPAGQMPTRVDSRVCQADSP
jgi:hypothetical protein